MPVLSGKQHILDHHKHDLTYQYFKTLYRCDGCNELGIHSGYYCAHCDFVLHEECIRRFGASFSFNRFDGYNFVFVKQFTISNQFARCDVCAKTISGYAYTAKTSNGGSVNMHPRCATLPPSFYYRGTIMKLVREISSNSKCVWCHNGHLRSVPNSWAYILTQLQIHVGCVTDFMSAHSELGAAIFGHTIIKEKNSYRAIPSSGNSTRPSNSTSIVVSKQPSSSKCTTSVPSKQPSNTKLIITSAPKQPSNNRSTAIVQRKQPSSKLDRIKQHSTAIGHAIVAVLAPFTAIVSFATAIATLIPLL